MPNLTMESMLAQLALSIKEDRVEYQNLTVRSVLATTIAPLFKQGMPTGGEMLTELLKLFQGFVRLETELRRQKNRLSVQIDFENTQKYWRERRPEVSAALHPHIDKLLLATLEERERRFPFAPLASSLEHALLHSEDFHQEYQMWERQREINRDQYRTAARSLEARLFEASEILPAIKDEIRPALEGDGFATELAVWLSACPAAAACVMRPDAWIFLNDEEMLIRKAFQVVREQPELAQRLTITLPIDKEVEQARSTYAAWQREGSVNMSPPLLFGSLRAFQEEILKEPLVRFFSELGLDILKDADLVLVRRGLHGYPAVYWLFASEASTVVFCQSSQARFDYVSVFNGSVTAAEAWIKEAYHPVRDWPESESQEVYFGTSESPLPETPKNIAVALDPEHGLDYMKSRLAAIG